MAEGIAVSSRRSAAHEGDRHRPGEDRRRDPRTLAHLLPPRQSLPPGATVEEVEAATQPCRQQALRRSAHWSSAGSPRQTGLVTGSTGGVATPCGAARGARRCVCRRARARSKASHAPPGLGTRRVVETIGANSTWSSTRSAVDVRLRDRTRCAATTGRQSARRQPGRGGLVPRSALRPRSGSARQHAEPVVELPRMNAAHDLARLFQLLEQRRLAAPVAVEAPRHDGGRAIDALLSRSISGKVVLHVHSS